MRKLIIAGFFFMIVSSDWAWSSQSSSPSFIPESFSANFVQEFKSLLSKKIKKSNGKIDYKFPSNIRFEMKGKSELTFVSNTKKSWYYTPSKLKGQPAHLRVGKASDGNLAQFFDILKSGLKTNKNYTVKKKDNGYLIVFDRKISKKINLLKALLTFKGKNKRFKNIKEIVLIRKKNKKVKMIFSKMKINKAFTSSHFVFETPENTRVSN